MSDGVLKITDLGLMPYLAALSAQEKTLERVASGDVGEILCVEHPPVITLGRHADTRHVLLSDEELKQRGIEVVRTDRGGEATCHNPGQMVIYPILPLGLLGIGVREYVDMLEQAVIDTLAELGVIAARDAQYPGVWIGSNKICAIGIRIKRRVSMHGIALNVSNDLGLFQTIVPCGIQQRGVTTLAHLGVTRALDETRQLFLAKISKRLETR